MKKTSKKKAEIKKGDVCVPCRFPDASELKNGLKTGVRAGGGGDPGTCPGKVAIVRAE